MNRKSKKKATRSINAAFIRAAIPAFSAPLGPDSPSGKLRVHFYPPVKAGTDPSTWTLGKYYLHEDARLEPMYLSDLFYVAPLSGQEAEHLRKSLKVHFSRNTRNGIGQAIECLVVTTALAPRLPTPRQFAERLQRIIETGRACLAFNNLIGKGSIDDTLDTGIVSIDTAVSHYLATRAEGETRKASVSNDFFKDITRVCEDALADLTPLLSRRGTKPDLAFRLFLESVLEGIHSSGISTALPSNAIKERSTLESMTPFATFVYEAIRLAKSKGDIALDKSKLPPKEIAEAKNVLARYATMSEGAVVDHLRKAKKSLAIS